MAGARDNNGFRRLPTGRAARRERDAADPVAAAAAFGAPRAPEGFAAAVMAAVADVPAPVRRPAAASLPGLAGCVAVIALWASWPAAGPIAVRLLAVWLQTLVAGVELAAAVLRACLAVATPTLALAAAVLVVAVEAALLNGWMRTSPR